MTSHGGETVIKLFARAGRDGLGQHVHQLGRPLVARTDLVFQSFQDQPISADAQRLRAVLGAGENKAIRRCPGAPSQ
jgi:hypothetical protein